LGWTDGRNVHIEIRLSAGNAADTRKYAAELAALAPDLILATGGAGLPAVLQATQTRKEFQISALIEVRHGDLDN
jgi:putative ABC transport system substrate-binding protein